MGSSSFEGYLLDPTKCSHLTMEERRELVYEISKWSHGGPDFLHSWTRRELLQILCAEMGKERKYTGMPKVKIIEHLLEIVSLNKSKKRVDGVATETQCSPANNQGTSKRQRKSENPTRLPLATNHIIISSGNGNIDNTRFCKNSACRATLFREDEFCKRCSCCICYQYDDNKDPSLWLVCSSDPPYEGDSCGLSCHVECALKHEQAGIAKAGYYDKLDGSFYCVSCRKVNDLLGCWRKQLLIAKDTRRVDTLCYRVYLSQKLLSETTKYTKLQEIVDTAVKKLESEVGPLFGLPVRMARGIVNRLSSGPEVQKLCASAAASLDSLLASHDFHPSSNSKMQDSHSTSSGLVSLQVLSPTSLNVIINAASVDHLGYRFWHRNSDTQDYPAEPTYILFAPNTKFTLSDLTPVTEYLLKVVSFCNTGDLGMWEVKFTTGNAVNNVSKCLEVERGQNSATNSSSLSNPSSEGDESNNLTAYGDHIDNPSGKHFGYYKKTVPDSGKLSDAASKDNISDSQNTSTGIGHEGTLGDSASILDEEGIMGEVGSVHDSTVHTDLQGESTNLASGNLAPTLPKPENKQGKLVDIMSNDHGSNANPKIGLEVVPYENGSDAVPPITPCKVEIAKDGPGRNCRTKSSHEELDNITREVEKDPQGGSPLKKIGVAGWIEGTTDVSFESEYTYCVKMIRWLECEGHIEKNFRVKFLTWYSLRASPEERRIVKVFIDTLLDDPLSLSGQLIDTFSERIFSKRPPIVSSGFCMKLFH